tara:strand:- start:12123 stop:12401 length:279 start_codon:yes stop_codon:yes gene_type:complete
MPSLNVTSPTSSSVWHKGVSQTITWSASSVGVTWENAWAVYLMDGGGTVATIATNLHNSIRSRTYTPPVNIESDNDYYILVSGQYTETGGAP